MLGAGPAATRSTTFGDSTFSEDELKYRYAANAATRTIAVFTLGKYRCHCLTYCLYRAVFGPCIGPQVLQKSLFMRPLSHCLVRTPGKRLRLREPPNRVPSAIADSV